MNKKHKQSKVQPHSSMIIMDYTMEEKITAALYCLCTCEIGVTFSKETIFGQSSFPL